VCFLLWDNLLKPSGPPATLSVAFTGIVSSPNTTLGTYLANLGRLQAVTRQFESEGLSPPEISQTLRATGVMLTTDLTITGPPGRQVELEPELQDLASGAIVPSTVASLSATVTSQATSDSATQVTWSPYPGKPGRYSATVRAYSEQGHLLSISPPTELTVAIADVNR
jgi:hypothetical protein